MSILKIRMMQVKVKNLKNNVKIDELKDIVKELERSIFGYEELSGSGLKILTNKQMLNRLPILLAQIQAGNNSSKLKNEARETLYSLYRSKELTKTVYNNLIKAIRSKELRARALGSAVGPAERA